jgi:crotonobetainyl-CoA:carnitine CoA-transferase CaiB-like acyl-CoA transferase
MEEKISGPLVGIRVLDFGQAALCPTCGRLLADLGADVIKVEPLEGDFARLTPEPNVDSVTFMVTNLNKRSLAINLRDPRGKEILLKMLPTTDVLIQNFRPGAMKNLALDYETLSAMNPRLIYGSFYMYGEKGPLARRRGGDMWAQAFTGLVASQGSPDGPPQTINHTVMDYCGGMAAAFAVMTALFERERTGAGQEVFNSLINTAVLLQWPAIGHYLAEGLLFKKVGRGNVKSRFPYGAYTAKDGDVLTIFGQDDEEWITVTAILGIEHLLADERYDTADKRNARKFELYPILDEAFKKKTRVEWEQLFREQKLRCDPCLDYAEFTAHPQFEANQLAVTVMDPREGEMVFPSIPTRLSKYEPLEQCNHAPLLGEHTEEILQEMGYAAEEIEQLKADGVVAVATP